MSVVAAAISRRTLVGSLVAALWFVGVLAVGAQGDLTEPASRMLAIFGAAVVLWVTEAIPLAATSILVILAQVLLISDEALVGLPADYVPPPFEDFFATLAHPVLILFLGGFVLAAAAAKYGLDRNLAGVLLRPFGSSPRLLLAGLMVITAALSMFMSNTATTAAMMAVVLPVAAQLEPADRFRGGLVLAIPVAANVGGIGTPVGSPPNAIALGRLVDEGVRIDFVEWMVLALPLAVVVLVAAWAVIVRWFPSTADRVDVSIGGRFDRSSGAVLLYVTFAATVVAWMTEPLHRVPSSIVAFGAVVVLFATQVFDAADLRLINWHVLWLVGGGIALGAGVATTGLDDWLVGLADWSALPSVLLVLALALLAIGLSTIISNSATANLLVPIGISIAASSAADLDPLVAGLIIALSCSLAMALPVSTPPNAVAYASGDIRTADLARVGAVVGAVGVLLVVFVGPWYWEMVGST